MQRSRTSGPTDPAADILTERSCTRDPHTEILHKGSYKILCRDADTEICARDPRTEILHK